MEKLWLERRPLDTFLEDSLPLKSPPHPPTLCPTFSDSTVLSMPLNAVLILNTVSWVEDELPGQNVVHPLPPSP